MCNDGDVSGRGLSNESVPNINGVFGRFFVVGDRLSFFGRFLDRFLRAQQGFSRRRLCLTLKFGETNTVLIGIEHDYSVAILFAPLQVRENRALFLLL